MYSYEDRKRAIELYIQYGKRGAPAVLDLGYPSIKQLRRWYRHYVATGDVPTDADSSSGNSYSLEKRQAAVNHYQETGRCVAHTTRALGYPDKATLRIWVDEDLGLGPKRTGHQPHQHGVAEKRQAVFELCTRETSAEVVAQKFGVTGSALYNWRNQLLGSEAKTTVKRSDEEVENDPDALRAEVKALEERVHQLQLEHDILVKASELVKMYGPPL